MDQDLMAASPWHAPSKDHGSFMASSKSLDRLRSIPGRTPPEALDTGNSTRPRRLAFGLATTSARASSISDVKVRPSSAARFLARCRRSSFILMVVLMHQNISIMHQYVKSPFKPVPMEDRHGKYQCANSNKRFTISLSPIFPLHSGEQMTKKGSASTG